ncbi:glycosyltransferase, partial [Enterococcus faecalis]|uniref:glycosyltransferase n=1 Tax=Enterococcus faecalis TaxID=1351 RepID=UPI0031CCF9B2
RHAGSDVATGKYITFVDSDDYFDTLILEVLYKNMVHEDAELSRVGVTSGYSGQEPEKPPSETSVVTQKEATKMILIGKQASVYAVAKLYMRNKFDDLR